MKPGATIFVHHRGFLPMSIRLHMIKWRHFLGRVRPHPANRYNHTETIIELTPAVYRRYFNDVPKFINGKILMACGARKAGAQMTLLVDYLNDHPDHVIKVPVVDLTPEQIAAQERYAVKVCFQDKREYEKVMFLKWILKIHTGADPGRHNDKKVYCFELAHKFDEVVGLAAATNELIDVYKLWDNKGKKLFE